MSDYRQRVSEARMDTFGACLARGLIDAGGGIVYLRGTLGMGKTTLSQAVIRGLGWSGRVKSPTYTLIEPYDTEPVRAIHVDLYRLADPEELEFIGVRDYLQPRTAWLIEWPEQGEGVLPEADLVVKFTNDGAARRLSLVARSETGRRIVDQLHQRWERA